MDNSIGDDKTIGRANNPGGHTYALKPGDLFGQYCVIRVLGAGGMGEVYEVEHTTLDRRYALKLLPETLDWKGVSLERFRREAKVMANLDHPNILKVDDFGEVDGRYWLRMELAEGVGEGRGSGGEDGSRDEGRGGRIVSLQDLADARGGKIPQEELLPILRQVLEGLQYAHSHGAIHRDLKPSNILLSEGKGSRVEAGGKSPRTSHLDPPSSSLDARPSPLVKIADFGLVRLVGEDWVRSQAQLSVQRSLSMGDQETLGGKRAESEGTSTRALLGTFEYMSPEQKRGEEADERSDLYAVGLMAYRLLTGRDIGPKLPSRFDPSLVSSWDDFVEQALEQELSERLPGAKDGLRLLEKIADDLESVAASARENERRKQVEAEERECLSHDQLAGWGVDLAEYRPTQPWQNEPIAEGQRKYLGKQRISTDGLTKGSAAYILDKIIQGKQATPAQVRILASHGVNAKKWDKDQAGKQIEAILGNRFKKSKSIPIM